MEHGGVQHAYNYIVSNKWSHVATNKIYIK